MILQIKTSIIESFKPKERTFFNLYSLIFSLDIFIAGSETTTAILVWAMIELAKDPNAMKKAQEEIMVLLRKARLKEIFIRSSTSSQYRRRFAEAAHSLMV